MKRIKKLSAVIFCVLTMLTILPISSFAAAKPLKPEMFTATNVTANSVDLTWLPSENALGYRIFAHINGKWKIVKDTKSTATTITGLVASKNYTFAIKFIIFHNVKSFVWYIGFVLPRIFIIFTPPNLY